MKNIKEKINYGLQIALFSGFVLFFVFLGFRILEYKIFIFGPAFLIGIIAFIAFIVAAVIYFADFSYKNILASLFVITFYVAIIISVIVLVTKVDKAWPAENTIQEKEDYIAILEQAENWPVIKENVNKDFHGIITKIHRNPNNFGQMLQSDWFPNKNNNYEPELFSKTLFRQSELKSEKAALKREDNKWIMGDIIVVANGLSDGKKVIAFILYDYQKKDNSIAIRFFLLEDLWSPKK